MPNLIVLFRHRVHLKSWSSHSFNQSILLTGKGEVNIEENCSFGYKLGGHFHSGRIEIQARYKNSRIKIFQGVFANNNLFICAANYVEIGKNTLIGENVTIMDHEAHGIEPSKRTQIGDIGTVIIEGNVWIGNNVMILKNSYIGANSIVAAGSVVTKKFPENVIVAGVPARIIKHINMN